MSKQLYKPVLAKLTNRLAAFLIDAIILVILMTGLLYLISLVFDFDSHYQIMIQEQIKEGYLILNEETEKYETILPTASNYEQVCENVSNNALLMENLFFVNSFSINAPLAALAIVLFITEFVIPLFLRNGQTIGMKCFHVALLSTTNIKINPIQLFARCLLGKIAILGVVPLLAILYIFLNISGGLFGTLIVIIVFGVQLICLLKTKNKTGIQDLIANVYPVDSTETIFYKTTKELQDANNQLSRHRNLKGK